VEIDGLFLKGDTMAIFFERDLSETTVSSLTMVPENEECFLFSHNPREGDEGEEDHEEETEE